MYHGEGISEAVFSGLRGGSGKEGVIQHIEEPSDTSCVSVLQRTSADDEDPTLPFFGSQQKKKDTVCAVRTVCINCTVYIECIVLYYMY
ncbi:hypothetical protein EJQ74_22010 [Salmonella enterica]|nr:hypothetical protein [Salmonella enterica]ECD0159093.1 hypothetical protein [Salmonella enterica subsp. enterica]ECH9653862.1 hypothetical protein [Salmonella enterica subsp. enterica serovar Miami]ECS7319222.1 hypothetical protein [Salmonella enterica subsp. enterica serovar Miami str. CFSAN000579]EAB4164778.1 hypothetical protein [Salmonella enterica]